MRVFALPIVLFAAACATPGRQPAEEPAEWRTAATADDRARLRDWRDAFVEAVAAARAAGHGSEIAKEGALLDPDAAIATGPLPQGDYRCRVIKVGAKTEGLLDYIAYPEFRCRAGSVGRTQSFAKITGSQRYVGRLYPGDAFRQIFLGTLVLGNESQAMRYGLDRERNIAGHVERIGPARWRLVMPRPHFESRLDVLELIPAAAQ